MIIIVNVRIRGWWECRCPARALAPVSPICRLIESLWDLFDERECEGHGHRQANQRVKLGLGHLIIIIIIIIEFMRKHLFDSTTV